MSERIPGGEADCCAEARARSLERIYHYLDGELSASEFDMIRAHLRDCRACSGEFEVEQLLKELVRRSCTAARAPEGLKDRIRQRIVYERTTIISVRRS